MPKSSIPFPEAFKTWIKISLLSFGGPAGQIAVMHRELVDQKKWISESRFLHALNYCMLLPGPEAQQLMTYTGWLLHGTLGGLTAGILFVVPGFISIFTLSYIYTAYQQVPFIEAAFFGLKAAVLAIVAEAVIRISRRALKNRVMYSLAGAAFIGIFFFNISFPWIICAAALIGFFGGKWNEELFYVIKPHAESGESGILHHTDADTKPPLKRTLRTIFTWLLIWAAPVLLMLIYFGKNHVLVKLALFFSQTAMVTFGGAYAVLPYVAQKAVLHYGWLSPSEMLTGLGMAETTPGPLIQVLQFVGYLAAYRNPSPFSLLTAALLGSIITTWVTYAPCFLWIFAGAPYIEHLRGIKSLSCSLSAITAAVVGVVLNLALWFGIHVLFEKVSESQWGYLRIYVPEFSSLNIHAVLISALAFFLLFRFKQNMLVTLGACVLSGILLRVFF